MLQRFHCEHVLEELGGSGPYQRRLLVLILFPFGLFIAFQTAPLYNQLLPDHWCAVPELANFSYGEQHRLIRPKHKTGSSISLYPEDNSFRPTTLSQCEMYDIDYQKAISGLEVTHSAIIRKRKPGRKKTQNQRIRLKLARLLAGERIIEDDDDEERDENSHNMDDKDEREVVGKAKEFPVIPTKACTNGWLYNREQFRSSAAMHYNMVCDNRNHWQTIQFYRSLSSAFFGPIHAFIGDRYGRKWCLFTILLTNLLSSVSPLLTTDYRIFLACQLLNASTYPIAIFALFVYGSEFMLPEWRSAVILLVCCSLHLGEWLAFLLAATISDWIVITAINSLIILPGFLLLTFMDESPHWILSRTRNSERLRKCFEKLNRINSGNLDRDSIKSIVNKFTHFSSTADSNGSVSRTEERAEDKDDEDLPRMTKLRLFLKRSSLIQIVLLSAFILGTNMLVSSELQNGKRKFDETSLVLDSFFGSLIKMPAIFLTWTMIEQRIGRRWSNVTILSVNLVTIIFLLIIKSFRFAESLPAWTDITGTMFAAMLAECSIVITFLIILEMSPSRFRLLTMSVTFALGKAISIAETRHEFLPIGLMAAEELMTNVHYWSMSKIKSDLAPSNLFLALSKWDINSNHSIVPAQSHKQSYKQEKLINS